MPRILVTGSRNWRDRSAIAAAISAWLESQGTSIGAAFPIPTVVHGKQVTEDRATGELHGADYLAHQVATNWGYGVEPHPAEWEKYGRKAGPIRNQLMVDLGADVCLAFPLGRSPGTRDCMRRARAAGIPVIEYGGVDA